MSLTYAAKPILGNCEVHIWKASFARLAAPDFTLLSKEERERADSFRFEHDRTRFASGRALLRLILARYLDLTPDAVALHTGIFGKPELGVARPLAFNLTHCSSSVLVAVAASGSVGVDAEDRIALDDVPSLVRLVFAPPDAAALLLLPDADRLSAFLRGWTRKEAVLKMTGQGFNLDPESVSVPLGASGSWRLRLPGEATSFDLVDVSDDGMGLVAALAVSAAASQPAIRSFDAHAWT